MVRTMDTEFDRVLDKLGKISKGLRLRNFSDAADRVDKDIGDLSKVVGNALSQLDTEGLIMEGQASPPSTPGSPFAGVYAIDTTTQGSGPTIQARLPRLVPTPQNNQGPINPKPAQTRKMEMPTFGPEDLISGPAADQGTGTAAPTRVGEREPGFLSLLEMENEEEAGEVILYGNLNMPNPLTFITTQIREGPLFDIVFNPVDRSATITFQRAFQAQNFLARNEMMRGRTGASLYGRAYTLGPGNIIPWTEQMRRMSYPSRERRRLTFARAGLFNSKLTPDKFKADMVQLVGEHNIEVSWVFNAGNATVVFRNIALARMVYEYFRRKTKPEAYANTDVTYSTDPCEKPMVYNSQLCNWQVVTGPRASMPPQQRRVRRQRRARALENGRQESR
ncbi:hypothetical protein FQN54_005004 [Arachnomyces sp. PD_36]|nr:hypothetical protein FQN54_005004 [Arachnomyces sp. PD_36]